MGITLGTLLGVLPMIGKAAAATPEFKELYDGVVDLLDGGDQDTAKEAYADLIEGNAAGFARLDAKLEAAKAK